MSVVKFVSTLNYLSHYRPNFRGHVFDQFIIKCDDNEQHSRRSCLRIHGLECNDDERIEEVLQRVKEFYKDLSFQDDMLIGSKGLGSPT